MVSIGKTDWYHKVSGTLPQQQPVSGAKFGYGNSGNGTLIDRLDAIDRGQAPVAMQGYSGNVNGDMPLQARLDAMGDGELHPNLNRNFDILA